MDLLYDNTEEQYIWLQLEKMRCSRKHKIKEMFLRIVVVILFGSLAYAKYKIDIDLFGYLTESASPVILVYIVCGILWVILLPILYWKLKCLIISKEIENQNNIFEGKVNILFDEDGISVNKFDGILKVNWSNINKLDNKKNIFVIHIQGDEEVLIPKSIFENQEDIEKFKEYINENISTNNIVEKQEV